MDLKRKYAQLFKGKLRSNDRSLLNEGDMTRQYDGFIITDRKKKTEYKFRYIKGRNNVDVEDDALAKIVKKNGGKRADYSVDGFVKKGQWNQSKAEVLETMVREANAPKTNDQKAENLVKKIIKGNSRFKWLNDDLPKNYTLDDVKTALDDAGYGKEYDKYIKEGEEVNEANEIPAPEDIISDGMAEVDRVIDELLDLEQSVMSSIEMYQEETGDLRFEQILNQGARYIQSAQRNLEYLHKMLKRNL